MSDNVDQGFIDFVSKQLCAICYTLNEDGRNDPDHYPTVGSCGRYHDNVWPLCRKHHTERHAIGIITFTRRYDVDPVMVIAELRKRWERLSKQPR